MSTAERELGAFLHAVCETAGPDLERKAGTVWLRMLEEADGFDEPQRVFRQTTIKALAELHTEMSESILLAS
jgi:hypothetical protein